MDSQTKTKNTFFTCLFGIEPMLKKTPALGELPTTAKAYQNFLKMAWPSALESLLVGLIGSIDTMMVGTMGENAINAVGITNQPKFILLAVIFSLNVGVVAVVARRRGENDKEGANHTMRVAILLSGLLSLLTSAFGFLFAKPILKFAGADPVYLSDAVTYFRILCVSIVFTALNLTINAAQRGCGNTKISMRTNIVANIVNVIFNYLLINGVWIFPKWGVAGAAVATALGAVSACAISFATLLGKNAYLSLRKRGSFKPTATVLPPVLRVSSSAFVEQVFMRIGFFAYAKIVAGLGPTPYAVHLICMNILNLSFCFGDGLGIAASALVGQNLGSHRPDLSTVYGKVGQRIAFICSTFLFLLFIGARHGLVWLFSKEPESIALGGTIMIIMAFSTHFQTSQVVLNGCLRGAGDSAFVAVTSMISIALIRPVLTYLLCFPLGLGLAGAWFSLILDQGFRFVAGFIRFSSGKWTRIRL
ncbi:MAG: MATE family efflux transporter [Lachnospiraceae bacterium]|jgi:putative MATE family efflux protein|nr:MATE family efflux transporter [Lachnospiraceae bacterium]